MTTCLTYTKTRLLISNTPLLAYALGPNCVSCVSPIAFLLYDWSPYLTSNNLKQIRLSMMTLLDVAAYQQKIKLNHRLEDWGYIDCFLKPMQITLLKKERKLEISFSFTGAKSTHSTVILDIQMSKWLLYTPYTICLLGFVLLCSTRTSWDHRR